MADFSCFALMSSSTQVINKIWKILIFYSFNRVGGSYLQNK